MPMNPEIKTAWVAALRSGEYQQTQAHLRNPRGFCCLGVLCDMAAKEGVGAWQEHEHGDFFSFEDHEGVLPSVVADWAGLYTSTPYVRVTYDHDAAQPLHFVNDTGASFATIATFIENDPNL